MSDPLLPIGELAECTGLSVTTIRYYDEIDLIAATTRVGGKRRFDADAIGRVSFIRRAQDAGFALDEIREILDDTSGDWRLLVERKLVELTERRRRLDTMIDMLESFRTCGCEIVATCPRMGETR